VQLERGTLTLKLIQKYILGPLKNSELGSNMPA